LSIQNSLCVHCLGFRVDIYLPVLGLMVESEHRPARTGVIFTPPFPF